MTKKSKIETVQKVELTREQVDERKINKLKEDLEQTITQCKKVLQKFVDDLQKGDFGNAWHTLEWSKEEFQAAAQLRVARDFLNIITSRQAIDADPAAPVKNEKHYHKLTYAVLEKIALDYLVRSAQSNAVARSTSPTANLAEHSTIEAYAKLIDVMKWIY